MYVFKSVQVTMLNLLVIMIKYVQQHVHIELMEVINIVYLLEQHVLEIINIMYQQEIDQNVLKHVLQIIFIQIHKIEKYV